MFFYNKYFEFLLTIINVYNMYLKLKIIDIMETIT